MIIDYLVLFCLLLLGIVSSFTDIKKNKIKNIHIVLAIIFSIVIGIAAIFVSDNTLLHAGYYFANILLCVVIGFLFWNLGFWTAGDGKLYIVYSVLLSSLFMGQSFLDYPFFSVLVFTFIPFFFFFSIMSIIRAGFEKSFSTMIGAFKPINIIRIGLFFFGAGWIFNLVPFFSQSFFLSYSTMFVFFLIVEKFLGKVQLSFFMLLSVFRIFLDNEISYIGFLISFSGMVLLLTLFRYAFIDLGFYAFTKEVKLHELKKGDLPAEIVLKKGPLYHKERYSAFGISRGEGKTKDQLFDITPEGLSPDDIKKLSELKDTKNLRFRNLRVYDTLPFAPFMLFGAFLSYIMMELGITIFI